MALKQFLIKHTPSTVKNKIRKIRSARELNSVETLGCETSNLRFENNISLSEIFRSEELNNFWEISRKEIAFF